MLSIEFPIRALGRSFNSFDDITRWINRLWFILNLLVLIVCAHNRIYLHRPVEIPSRGFIYARTIFHWYLWTTVLLYSAEILLTNILWSYLDRFVHHVVAIIIMLCAIVLDLTNYRITCVFFVIPNWFHSIYWISFDAFHNMTILNTLLTVYNVSIGVCYSVFAFTDLKNSFVEVRRKRYSIFLSYLVIETCVVLLLSVNLTSYFYGYNIDILKLNMNKLASSLLKSFIITSPFYMFLIYKNSCRKLKPKKTPTYSV